MFNTNTPSTEAAVYPVLPLRDIVVFPHMIVPLFVGREKSVNALEQVMNEDKQILLVTQKEPSQDDPGDKDLHDIGTIGKILQLLKLPDGTVKVLVEGTERVRISEFVKTDTYLEVKGDILKDESERTEELDALSRAVATQFEQYVKLNKKIPPEVIVSVNQIEEPSKMADSIASHLALKLDEKQDLLGLFNTTDQKKSLAIWKAKLASCKSRSVFAAA